MEAKGESGQFMRTIDYEEAIPRYVQVKQWLEKQIGSGRWQPGDTLPSEKELANQLKVSPLTVSRALQWLAREGVVVRKRRYGTIIAAQLPVHLTERENELLILVHGGGARYELDFYVGGLHRGIQSRVNHSTTTLRWLDYHTGDIQKQLKHVHSTGILAITPDVIQAEWLEKLYRDGTPVVVLGAGSDKWQLPFVDSDNYNGARQAVDWLIKAGHRRFIGLFGYPAMLNTQDRWRGFRDALKEAGIVDRDIWTFTVTGMDHFEEPVRDAVGSLLRLPNPPTAILAGGYYLALAALQIAYDNNTRVPEQLSVIGCDDPPSASLSVPALTTLRQPLEQMGAQAADILMKLIQERPEKPPHIRFPLELILRSSTFDISNQSKMEEE